MSKTARDLIVEGKEIIQKTGVNRDGAYVNEEKGDCLCTLGAVYVAAGAEIFFEAPDPEDEGSTGYYRLNYPDAVDFAAYHEAEDALRDAVLLTERGGSVVGVANFNDTSSTDEEVFDLFDTALTIIDNSN